MKRLLSVLCIVALLLSAVPLSVTVSAAESVDFAILSTTDMHGKCWDTNVLTDGTESNNMLRVSTAVKQIRETYGADNVITVDNGDLYQGTPVSSYQISLYDKGESTDPLAMALCLAEIGYDVSVLGNHEFNYSWDTMNDARTYLISRGVSPICANLYYDGTDGTHTKGENVFTPYITKDIAVGDKILKIGILGLENTDCTRWDVPDNYPGVVFAHPDNTTMSMAWEVDRYLPQMQAEGCDFIIVSYHSGLGSADGDLVFGVNTENQISRIVANCSGIDMIIAGHDHSTGYSNTKLTDKDGKEVLVVNGGGTQLTQSVFTATVNGDKIDVSLKESRNLALKDYAADTALKEKIAPYAELASAYVNKAAGKAVGDWDSKRNFYLEQTDTMDLINRAQIAMGSKYMALAYDTQDKVDALYAETGLDHLDVDISSTSVVTNGSYTVSAGDITMKDIYKMYKYDNNLYLLALTGQQIKDILEYNATNHLKAKVSGGTVTYSTKGEDFTNPVFGGLKFTYDMAQPEGSRVIITGLDNGRDFALDKVYIVGVNNYHLGNTGCGFGNYSTSDAIWSQNDNLGGGVVQDLIYEFIADETAENGGVSPYRYSWKLDYTGSLDDAGLSGDIIARNVTELTDGQKVLVYYNADATVIGAAASAENANRLGAVDTTAGAGCIGTTSEAAVFTVEMVDAEKQYYALKTDAGYLTSGETGNSLGFQTELTDCGKWYNVAVDGGFHIMNVGANYGGNYNQALEWYTGFTTYGVGDSPNYLFNFYTPVEVARQSAEVKDGGRYVIYLDQEELSVSSTAVSGGLAAAENPTSGGIMPLPLAENTLIVTAHIADGKIDFVTDDGLHMTSAASGNGLSLTAELAEGDCSLWTLTPVSGGWHVMNVGANYNGNHNQALEWYNKFTTYGVKDTGAYLFNFYELAADEDPCANGHSWDAGVVTTEPTCTTEGVKTYTCSCCGATKTETVEALGHDYATETVAPTYFEGGYDTHTCSRCGDSYRDKETAKLTPDKYYEWEENQAGPADGVYAIGGFDLATDGKQLFITALQAINGTVTQNVTDNWRDDNVVVLGSEFAWYFTKEDSGYYTIRSIEHGQKYLAFNGAGTLPVLADTVTDAALWTVKYDNDSGFHVIENKASAGSYLVYNYAEQAFQVLSGTYEGYEVLDAFMGVALLRLSDDPCARFTDVDRDAWYHEYVDYAISHKLFLGTGENTFSPNQTMSRDMLVTVLYRMAGEPEVSGDCPFTDVKDTDYFAKAVCWAYSNEIVFGVTDTEFGPTQTLTREQLASMLFRVAKNYYGLPMTEQGDLSKFPDSGKCYEYSKPALSWAVGAGIIAGDKSSSGVLTLNPKAGGTRAEVATMLQRFEAYLAANKK